MPELRLPQGTLTYQATGRTIHHIRQSSSFTAFWSMAGSGQTLRRASRRKVSAATSLTSRSDLTGCR